MTAANDIKIEEVPPAEGLRIVREHETAMQRAVDEANEYIVSSDDSIVVGAIADLIESHPHLFAIRFLRLEREVEEVRRRLDASSLFGYREVQP